MATKKFILQGLTANTHTDAIKRIFEIPNIEQVILSVAFINEGGVCLIEDQIRSVADRVKIFSGIRNDITSCQGLSRLLNLGASVYAVDTGARNIVFHPKLYFARNAEQARLVIGSANLTLGGLNNNIEAGMAIDLDLNDQSESELAQSIESEFLVLPTRDPEHIVLLTSEEDIEILKQSGRILDESEVLPPRPTARGADPSLDVISRIRLDVPRRHHTIKRTRVTTETTTTHVTETSPVSVNRTGLKLMWASKDLTERDLNIPSGVTTNPTGSINLDKGLLGEGIDPRHYFREEVFSHLTWNLSTTRTVEESTANFELIVKGISYGEFTLRIAHTIGTESAAYRQHNAMTRLSWGLAREHIAHRDLIGRTLSLYRNEGNPTHFSLEID